MENKEFDIIDNFKRRYAALLRIDAYLTKWENSKGVRFSSREKGTLGRMHTSIQRNVSILEDEYYRLFNQHEDLEKYVNDNGNKNK